MMHVALPTARRAAQPTAPHLALPPLSPAAYLSLRRRASGLSGDAVARIVAPNNRADLVALVTLLETEGATAKYRETIVAFMDAFPIDPDVYFQLRDAAPERHPRICRGCGCSKWDPCVAAHGGETCGYHDAASCTRCAVTPAIPVHQ